MSAKTHGAVVGVEDLVTEIVTPDELTLDSNIDQEDAEEIFDLAIERAEGKSSGQMDLIVVLEEWATGYPEDDPIADSTVILAGEVEDYSEKALLLIHAYNVLTDELDDKWLTNKIEIIDETDDGAPNEGRSFVPKSAVDGIFLIDK